MLTKDKFSHLKDIVKKTKSAKQENVLTVFQRSLAERTRSAKNQIDKNPWKCQNCPAIFPKKKGLKDHTKKVHEKNVPKSEVATKKEPEIPNQCQICTLKFRDKDILEKHIEAVHGDEILKSEIKPEKSNTEKPEKKSEKSEKKSEKSSEEDQNVKKEDANETKLDFKKTIECDICLEKFPNQNVWKNHRKEAHGKHYFQCTVCSARYHNHRTLRKHQLEMHGKEDPEKKNFQLTQSPTGDFFQEPDFFNNLCQISQHIPYARHYKP